MASRLERSDLVEPLWRSFTHADRQRGSSAATSRAAALTRIEQLTTSFDEPQPAVA